jgi:SAM-dependent methyltransferase
VDNWKFYEITHRGHVVCNPTSVAKLDEVVRLIDLPPRPRVLDIACGKGEFLVRLGEARAGPGGSGFRAVGVDLSPFCIADVREAAARRIPTADLELLEMDGADYRAEPESFDLASCLGASWTFGGHIETLRALAAAVPRGGHVLVGEPFWRREPDPGYLAAEGLTRDAFGSHRDNVEAGVAEGLIPLLALASSDDDWHRYEALQWAAAADYADSHPDDPDLPELIERVERSRDAYLTWGRDTLGWSLYLFARGR